MYNDSVYADLISELPTLPDWKIFVYPGCEADFLYGVWYNAVGRLNGGCLIESVSRTRFRDGIVAETTTKKKKKKKKKKELRIGNKCKDQSTVEICFRL